MGAVITGSKSRRTLSNFINRLRNLSTSSLSTTPYLSDKALHYGGETTHNLNPRRCYRGLPNPSPVVVCVRRTELHCWARPCPWWNLSRLRGNDQEADMYKDQELSCDAVTCSLTAAVCESDGAKGNKNVSRQCCPRPRKRGTARALQ